MTQKLFRRTTAKTDSESDCPICAGLVDRAPYQFLQENRESLIFECSRCDFLFGRPVFIPEQNHRQMDSINDAELYNSKTLKFFHRELVLKREIRLVRSILGAGSHRVLDIGCGTGWTSAFWRDSGFDVTGLEPSADRSAVAREKYGISVISSYLEEAEIDEKFDLVILRHIVEHFEEPRALLEKASHLVKPKGLLLVVVPNIKCLGKYLFDTSWTWVLPWHCNFFSPRSLRVLVRSLGFKGIASFQSPSPLYYQESMLRRFPYHWLKRLFSAVSPAGLLALSPLVLLGWGLGMGDNLCIVAERELTGAASDGSKQAQKIKANCAETGCASDG